MGYLNFRNFINNFLPHLSKQAKINVPIGKIIPANILRIGIIIPKRRFIC